MAIDYFENGEKALDFRTRLNRLVDVANAALTPATFVGPQGPQGARGVQGPKGDPGTYTGVALSGVVDTTGDLPADPADGTAYAVRESGTLEIHIYDGTAWENAGSITETNVSQTVFVSPTGDDNNLGGTFNKAVATLETAAAIARSMGGQTAVMVYPGTYETEGHINWPDNCSVIGVAGARKTKVVPVDGYEERNTFRLGDAGYVEGFSFEGFRVDDLNDPTEGFAIAFRPHTQERPCIIRRVPYVHNIVAYRGQEPSLITRPLDRTNGNPAVGKGGGVVIADRAQISEYSAFPNIMTWGATPSVPNGVAYVAKNGALVNPVSAVCLWAHKHFVCLSGGQMILSGCSSQFGDYSLWSEGYTWSVSPAPYSSTAVATPTDAGIIAGNHEALIAAMWAEIVNDSPNENEEYTKKDLGYGLTALEYSIEAGLPNPFEQFIRGLYDYRGQPVYCCNDTENWVAWFNSLRDRINALPLRSGTKAVVTDLIAMLTATLLNPTKRVERSLLTAINHQWTYPLAGVTRQALPTRFKSGGKTSAIQRTVVTRNGGRVQYSGQDDAGNAVFVGGLSIDSRSGELRGAPFDLAVKKRALRAAISRSY